ncbi:MAG: DegQ family serine endoprotease [Kiritimatiellales bacterium]|nr:DegQ family serine endoprotease [Kiritimatiellales bacterium]
MLAKKFVVAGLVGLMVFASVPARGNIEILEKTGSAFKQIAKDALPAVVFVSVETKVEVRGSGGYYFHPYGGQGGGRGGFLVPDQGGEAQQRTQVGQGSGFIISKDGYILTNNHVVNDADHITVTMNDGRKLTAKLVGTDPKSEVALIKVDDGDQLPFVPLGDSDGIDVGEWVLAAGSPFGLAQTITAGIVSAKGRNIGIADYENFIQTDAAINPGNSGGPLLNIRGEVIGINTAIYTQSGGYMGVGFAIPINMAKQIKNQLIEHGRVSRSYLGIYIQEVNEDIAASFGLDESEGILVSQVMEESSAAEAGVKAGDVIVEIDGDKVGKLANFRNRVAATPPGSKLELKVYRNKKYRKVSAITKELPDGEAETATAEPAAYKKLGLTVDNLDEDTAKQLGYEEEEGVIITEVEQGSPAWRAGLQPGLLIASVNRKEVGNVMQFRRVLSKLDDADKVLLLVKDGRSSRFIVVTID